MKNWLLQLQVFLDELLAESEPLRSCLEVFAFVPTHFCDGLRSHFVERYDSFFFDELFLVQRHAELTGAHIQVVHRQEISDSFYAADAAELSLSSGDCPLLQNVACRTIDCAIVQLLSRGFFDSGQLCFVFM